MTTTCSCHKYGDLPLNMEAIENRASEYKVMSPNLKQLSQKVVERWFEHYRLFKCEVCGQLWQSSLSLGDSESMYLYQVPKITLKDWKSNPYVAPDFLLRFIKEQSGYLNQSFELKNELCNVNDCNNQAVVSTNKCQFHHFRMLCNSGMFCSIPKGRWFSVYQPELLNP